MKREIMKKTIALIFCTISLIVKLLAGDAERLFAEGTSAYQQKDYQKAIEIFENLLESGYHSADLEYNLGNAWFRQDSPGRAILHYERALILNPKHAEAAKNLAFVRTKINDETVPLPRFFLADWWVSARKALSTTSFGVTALVIWWVGFAVLGFFWLLGKTRQQKKWGLLLGIGLLFLSLLPFGLALSRSSFEKNSRQAILIQKTAIIRSGPADNSQEVQTISEGVKFEQLEHLDGWWQVRLENGEVGWLPEQAMEKI